MKLPEGWGQEIIDLERRTDPSLVQLHTLRQEALSKLKDKYVINHPERQPRFSSVDEAARVVAHYWLKDKPSEEEVARILASPGMPHNVGLLVNLGRFYEGLTSTGSVERAYVEKAMNYLIDHVPG